MKSWKTTTAGACTIIGAIAGAIAMLVDGDPKTNPQWELVAAAIATGFGLLFARDNNVTSSDLGLTKKENDETTQKS